MTKFKRGLALLTSFALVSSLSIAGTLAYLTDRDSEANVFTIGNVDIELKEDFGQGATLIPGKKIEKCPTITNTGKNDAWVWAEIAIPAALDNDDASKNVIHFNFSKDSIADGFWNWTDNTGAYRISTNKINGMDYKIYTVLYETALASGKTTEHSVMTKVYMDTHVDIDPDGNWYWVNNGEATALNWNTEDQGNPIMYVSAYAIQAEGFESVQDAYKAYNGQWGDNGKEYANPATVVTTAEGLSVALENGEAVILDNDVEAVATAVAPYGNNVGFVQKGGVLDGNGHTLTVTGGSKTYAIMTYGGTIKNLTIDSGVRGIVTYTPTEDVIIDNVVIDGPGYAINSAEQSAVKLIVSNSTVNGWTSFGGFSSASFSNCKFGTNTAKYWYNAGYAESYDRLIRPYVATTFKDCEFEQGFTLSLGYLNGADVIFENCYCDGTKLTADNVGTYLSVTGIPESVTFK